MEVKNTTETLETDLTEEKKKEHLNSTEENCPTERKKRKHRKTYEITLENDIRYRGPLSYRHLRIFAWFFLTVAQTGFIFSTIVGKFDPYWVKANEGWINILTSLGNLTLPLFLLAAFAVILNAKNGYKKLIISYTVFALLFAGGFILFYYHYFVGTLTSFVNDPKMSENILSTLIYTMSKSGYISVNIFVDLALCSLFMFFINYYPQKYFQGKKRIIFRLFALIPIIYEAVSIYLKVQSILGRMILPIAVYPFLTTKPPTMFLFFIVLALFIKKRERMFCRKGKTHAEYGEFLKTNANSLHFSIFTTIAIIITVLIDIFLLYVIASIMASVGVNSEEEAGVFLLSYISLLYGLGIGKSVVMIFTIPFVLLFSYTRTYKNASIDRAIPLFGVGLLFFVYFEGFFQLLKYLPTAISYM